MPAPTGAHTTLWYFWEEDSSGNPDFAAGTSTNDATKKVPGGNATLSQFEGSNNAVEIFQPNDREMAQLIAQHFDGAWTLDFEWTNPWWLKGVISDPTTVDNGDGTHTHTFDGDLPYPMHIRAGYDSRAGGPAYRDLEGCVVQSATADVSTEGTVEVSLSGAYVNEDYDDSIASLDSQPSLSHDVMTFADALLDLGGSSLSLVQDASVEINNNTDVIRELGTRFGVDYSPKARVPTVDYTKIRENNNEVADMYGSDAATAVQQDVDSSSAMTYSVDNGVSAGSGQNTAQFDLSGAFPESLSTENVGNPQEDLQEAINRRLKTVTAQATNETSTAK